LRETETAWLCTVRPDGSPHLTPVWFWFQDGTFWFSSAVRSVNVANTTADPRVSVALPDGDSPVVAEGVATVHRSDFPAPVVAALAHKYGGWDVTDEAPQGPRALLEVRVSRWLMAGTAQ
jgi:PPOX class probable F420-dependent enzyme